MNGFPRRAARLPVVFPFLALLSFAAGVAHAEEYSDAIKSLAGMQEAAKKRSFEGTFVYQRNGAGGGLDAVSIVRNVTRDGSVQEHLVTLTGEKREIIRDDAGVRLLSSRDRRILAGERHDLLFSLLDSRLLTNLSSRYSFLVKGDGRVAGRMALGLLVTPKDEYRYGYNMWLDKESGLLLCSEMRDVHGKVLERFMFTRIELAEGVSGTAARLEFPPNEFAWNVEARRTSQKDIDDSLWRVGELPSGFEKIHHERIALGERYEPLEHLILTDGMAMISLFIERQDEGSPVEASFGQVINMGGGLHILTVDKRGYRFTAMGEVPGATVQFVADSVHWGGRQEP